MFYVCPRKEAESYSLLGTLWGVPVVPEEAKNMGQWRNSFQVVITGSNGKCPLRLSPMTSSD